MKGTKQALAQIQSNLRESMGERSGESRPQLSPVPNPKDVGRRPLRGFGTLPLSEVMPDPDQPRTEIDNDALERLAQSLRDRGQLLPIRTRWSEDHQRWIILSGERRWRAAQRANLETIECYFQEAPLSASEILEEQLVENLLREDLQPLEEAKAFAELKDLNGWTNKQVAQTLRVTESKVSRALALLTLPPKVQAQVEQGILAVRSAYELTKLNNAEVQEQLAARITEEKLPLEQVIGATQQRQGKKKSSPKGKKLTFGSERGIKVTVTTKSSANYHEIAEALQEALEEVQHRIDNNVQLF